MKCMNKYNADGSVARTNEERLALKSARAAEGVVAAAEYERDAQAAIDRISTLRAARMAQQPAVPAKKAKKARKVKKPA
jgi:hypothetical protein